MFGPDGILCCDDIATFVKEKFVKQIFLSYNQICNEKMFKAFAR